MPISPVGSVKTGASGGSAVKRSPTGSSRRPESSALRLRELLGKLRPLTPLSLDDARRVSEDFVTRYNEERLHSAIGYVTPRDKLEGREQ